MSLDQFSPQAREAVKGAYGRLTSHVKDAMHQFLMDAYRRLKTVEPEADQKAVTETLPGMVAQALVATISQAHVAMSTELIDGTKLPDSEIVRRVKAMAFLDLAAIKPKLDEAIAIISDATNELVRDKLALAIKEKNETLNA